MTLARWLSMILVLGASACGDPAAPRDRSADDERACEDSDADDVCDEDDVCEGGDDAADRDGDGQPDACDPCPSDRQDDSDGDGVCDSDDVCPGADDNADRDRDGTPDACDPCPEDFYDDSDGDGVCDSDDVCEGGDDNRDRERDGVPDACDNCPDHRNAAQVDADGDGYGDVCDRPDEAPDIWIIGVSGHTITQGGRGLAPYYGGNTEYLAAKRRAPQSLATRLEELGWTVGVSAYADEFYNWDPAEYSDVRLDTSVVQYGFVQLASDLTYIRDNWVQGFDNPTRVVVMAHSHGDVWAHHALFLVDDLPVEVLIDIDGESRVWEREWALHGDEWVYVINEYSRREGVTWAHDITNAADGWSVPSHGSGWDIEDIVPDSVKVNLEIQASGIRLPLVNDDEDNIREDGSLTDLYLFESTDSHTEVTYPDGEALLWAFEETALLLEE